MALVANLLVHQSPAAAVLNFTPIVFRCMRTQSRTSSNLLKLKAAAESARASKRSHIPKSSSAVSGHLTTDKRQGIKAIRHVSTIGAAAVATPEPLRRTLRNIRAPGIGINGPAIKVDEGDAAYSTADASFRMQPGAVTWTSPEPFKLQLGGTLRDMTIAYETWGTLNRYGMVCRS